MSEHERPLSGKVAVITGASSGIGKATATAWAELGADVVISARSDAPRDDGYPSLVDTRKAVEAAGSRCLSLRVDVNEDADIARLVSTTRDEFGRIDILMNNAAALVPEMNLPIEKMTVEQWRYQVNVNLTAPWLVTKSFLPLFDRGGIIVNMTSGPMPGEPPLKRAPGQGFPGAAYPTTKAGVNRLSAVLANELAKDGIAVVALHPGRALTERGPTRLPAAGYDPADWQDLSHSVGRLVWVVTHEDPMSLSGTVVYTPQEPRTQD